MQVCIFGGTGFVGHHLVAELIRRHHQVNLPTRNRHQHWDLTILPGVELYDYDARTHDLTSLVEGADVVINLVGILNERGHDGAGFRQAHVEMSRRVVEACQRAGVKRLLHMSALNADRLGPSHYLRTKGEAEDLVHDSGLEVTSFRPSVIFGGGDSFFNRFAGLLRTLPLAFPLACPNARFAPIFVGDVVGFYCQALDEREFVGRRLDVCGPEELSLREVIERTDQMIDRRHWVIGLPNWAAQLQANVMEYVPGKPFSRDNLNSLQVDSVCRPSADTLVGETRIEEVVPEYLGRSRRQRRYDELRRHAHR